MKVCIAEKPSVAREIAHILGAKSRKDGYLEGNGYAVTWTFGHFCTLWQPEDYKPMWKSWNLDSLPMLPEKFETKLMSNPGVKKQFKIIQGLLKKAERVINCGDAGQEGELIQRWVLKEAKYTGPVDRLWISSLTATAIREGFKKLVPAENYDRLFFAGSARAIGDWLLGMNATRLYTLKYGGQGQVLSVGRVQTPTLAMIVERHKEIEAFVSAPFWELTTLYREASFSCEKGKFDKKEDGLSILVKVENQPFTITSVEQKEGKEYAYKLFDLTSLQVHCNKRFSYSADQTLKIVQKLYEMKVVTYPRVDTNYLPEDLYPQIPGILRQMSEYASFTEPLLKSKIRKSKKVFDNAKITDHHAIIPTGQEARLDAGQRNVYDAIARQFIANFYPDCKVSNTKVKGESNGIIFRATGKEILEPGWKVLFPPKPGKKEKDEEKTLPNFKEGESGPHTPTLVEKKTSPPKYYTEASLLRAMETAGKNMDDEVLRELMKENGIGRPSTRASIIETLFRRKYVRRQNKNLVPTITGVQLIDTIQNELLKSAELTGKWEKRLKEIETANYNPKSFIQEMKKMVDNLVTEVRLEKNVSRIAPPVARTKSKRTTKAKSQKSTTGNIEGKTCPKCKNGSLLKGKTAYGCSQYTTGCRFLLPFSFMGKKISDNQLERMLNKGCTVSLKGFKEGKTKVNGLLRFGDNFEIVLERPKSQASVSPKKKEDKTLCPSCKQGHLIRGNTAYGCSRYKSGCDFLFPYDKLRAAAKGQTLTKELAIRIITSAVSS